MDEPNKINKTKGALFHIFYYVILYGLVTRRQEMYDGMQRFSITYVLLYIINAY